MRSYILSMCATIGVCGCGLASGAEPITMDGIRAAWKQRRDRIRSFQYECSFEITLTTSTLPTDDLFDRPVASAPSQKTRLRNTLVLIVSGEKISSRTMGETWDASQVSIKRAAFQAAFDGKQSRTLHEDPLATTARIIDSPHADGLVNRGSSQTAIWLAHEPAEYLTRLGRHAPGLEVKELNASYNRVDCLMLVTASPRSRWRTFLYVDPARDYLPIGLLEKFGDVTKYDMSLKYTPDKKVGWALSKWSHRRYNDTGEVVESTISKVNQYSYNEPMDDKLFELEFPIGSRVIRGRGNVKKYFVQEADGVLRPITPQEFGDPRSLLTK